MFISLRSARTEQLHLQLGLGASVTAVRRNDHVGLRIAPGCNIMLNYDDEYANFDYTRPDLAGVGQVRTAVSVYP